MNSKWIKDFNVFANDISNKDLIQNIQRIHTTQQQQQKKNLIKK